MKKLIALIALLLTVGPAYGWVGGNYGTARDRIRWLEATPDASPTCTATNGGDCVLGAATIGAIVGKSPIDFIGQGDLLVFACACSSTSAAATCTPTGATGQVEIANITNGATNMRLSLNYLVVEGANLAETITCIGSGGAADGTTGALMGMRLADPIEIPSTTVGTATGNSTNPNPPALGSASTTDMFRVVAACASANLDAAVTVPSTYSGTGTNTTADDSGVDVSLAMGWSRKDDQIGIAENPAVFGSWITGQWACATSSFRVWQ